MTSIERAVGQEATIHAKPGCRLCNGSGVMQRWDPGAWRRRTAALSQEPDSVLYGPSPELCGCAIKRMMKRYKSELEFEQGLLCWKEGFAPKQKQVKIMAQLNQEAQNARPDRP